MPIQLITGTNSNTVATVCETAIPLSVLPVITVLNSIAPGINYPGAEIWIGYTKNGHHFLDKQAKAPHMEEQVRALRDYYEKEFTLFERAILHLLYCKIPVVQVGELHMSLQQSHACGDLPREVQFDSLEENPILSAGFLRPELLQDRGSMFHDTDAFDVKQLAITGNRSVFCIGHIINKKLLIRPLILTISIAVVVAVVVGHLTRSVGSGAEVGSFVGVILSLVWAYALWMSG